MTNRLILITVPHAASQFHDPNRRDADLAAEYAASVMESSLKAYKFETKTIVNNKYKRTLNFDMNRKTTRNSVWRMKVTDYIKQSKPVCLLDIHSFPGNTKGLIYALADFYNDKVFASNNIPWLNVFTGQNNDVMDQIEEDVNTSVKFKILLEFSESRFFTFKNDNELREICMKFAESLYNSSL